MKTREELKAQGFTLTDVDTNQWVKKITETNFVVYEEETEFDIELKDYTDDELDDYASPYYPSLSKMKEVCGKDYGQIMAECIAEQNCH